MKSANIYYTPDFLKLWRKTPQTIKNKAVRREKLLRQNVFHPTLRVHKLKGNLEGYYSFYVDYHYRIVFHIEGKDIYFDAIGTHSVYK